MPYIPPSARADIQAGMLPTTPGELNYAITRNVNFYLLGKELSYSIINDIIGALEGAKLEFYRRVVIPYENTKLAVNGDVYYVKAQGAEDDFPGQSQE